MPPNYVKIYLAVLCLWCSIIFVFNLSSPAQQPRSQRIGEYNLRIWKSEDGLPQNSVSSIIQTSDGYLWLGTFGGLVRFDGIKFQVFGSLNGLSTDRIRLLFESRDGVVWIVTDTGELNQYKEGKFRKIEGEDGLPAKDVRSIYEDRAGNLWFGTKNGVIRWRDGQAIGYTADNGLPQNYVNCVLEDRNGNIWLGTGSGLVKFINGQFVVYQDKDGLSDNDIRSLLEDAEGNLWIGTFNGLNKFKDGTFTSYKFGQDAPNNRVSKIFQNSTGDIWVGTDKGLHRFKDGTFTDYFKTDGLSADDILSIFEDREGSLWIGTGIGGLNRLRKGVITSYSQENGFPAKGIVPILEDKEKNLWIGATCGGLIKFRDNKFTLYNSEKDFPNTCIWALHQDQEESLWIGTWSGGLLRRSKDGKFDRFPKENGLPLPSVTSIIENHQGIIWIGTTEGLYQFKDGIFTIFSLKEGLANERIHFLKENREGALLIGTEGGFSRFKDGQFINYSVKEGLSGKIVREIKEDEDGTLWIGTYGNGLSRFKNGKFTNYTTKEGLFDNIASRILEDDDGAFWISGNKGIYTVKRQDLNDFADGKISKVASIGYGNADGMKVSETNGGGQPSGYKDHNGFLWFPTIDGLVSVDPKNLNKVAPPVVIEQIISNGSPVELAQKTVLAAGTNNLEITYTALSFVSPEKVKFKYQLEGYDKDWIEVNGRRTAYYTNLPPGEYRFRVIASNDDGVWNETGAAFEFRLEPYFYQTYSFYGLCVLGAGMMIIGLHRFRVRQLEKQQKVLEARQKELTSLVEERTQAELALRENHQQLEEAVDKLNSAQKHIIEQERLRALSQMASGVAHDFNNSLAPILGYTELLLRFPKNLEDKEKIVQNLNIINTAAKDAAKIVSRLRSFYRLPTEGEKFLRVNLSQLAGQALSLTKPKWKDQALLKGVTIQTKIEFHEELFIACDESEIREVLINLIFNAVDAMPEGGTLTLRTFAENGDIAIEITDTGTGMSEEVRQKCLEPFFSTKGEHGTGLGLSMVYGIIQRHNGRIGIESELGKGTTFRLSLPKWEEEKIVEAEEEQTNPTAMSLNILLVDDESPIREVFSQLMKYDGHQVETAADGMEGLKKFEEGRYELVITDSAMPNMNGEQMAKAIKEKNPKVKIILMTGFGQLMKDAGNKPTEIDTILSKPVSIDELQKAIVELFDIHNSANRF